MATIGRFLIASLFFLHLGLAQAAIHAGVDRNELSLDESLSLKITGNSEKSSNFEPKFDAPDFEVMNQFESSSYSSVYTNGKFENKSEKTVTYILRPLKNGTLKIKNIRNLASDEKAQDITVQVSKDIGSSRKSLTGEAPSLKGDAKNFFVKAEVTKSKVYKGEQLIVSYYLYRRTRANLRDVMQYPTFQGFIREDMEMPVLSGRPDFEAVSLGGIPFERALLARYALYPIKEGKLKIDGLSIRADYIPKNSATDDMFEDPFFQFFSQVTPRTGTSKSDPVNIDVEPLPEDGRTSLFTGGVGTFEVNAQVDQAGIKMNAPFTVKISIQGKGNASLIEFPQVSWPKEFKFYESQGKSKNLGQGNTEKSFEVVLVPQTQGSLQVPPIEFQFFDPETRSYVTKKTNSIPIQVGEADAQSTTSTITKQPEEEAAPANSGPQTWGKLKIKDAMTVESTGSFLGQPWWKWVSWIGLLVFFSFIGLVAYDQVKKRSQIQIDLLKRKKDQDSFWTNLQREAQNLAKSQAPPEQFVPLMEQMIDQLHRVIDERFKVSSRSLARRELAKLLTDPSGGATKLTDEQWKKLSSILEFAEMIRFVSNAGVVSADETRARATNVIEDASKISSEISAKT